MPPLTTLQKNTDQSISIDKPDNAIIAAFATKKICDCSPRELDIQLAPAINQAFKFIGKRDSESLQSEIKFIFENLPGEMRAVVPGMRSGEIFIAIKRGLLKEFGDYFGLNVAEILRFCKSHYESDQRAQAAKQTLKPTPDNKQAPSKESLFYLYKNNLLEAYTKNAASHNIEVNAPALYDFCDKLKLIIFTSKEKFEFLNQAAQAVIKDQQNILFVTVEDFKRKPYQKIIDDINNSINDNKPVQDNVKTLLIMKSKFLTLKAFFNNIESNELNLSELIDSKKDLFINEG